MAITAHRHTRASIAAAGTELVRAKRKSVHDASSDTGAWSLQLQNNDAQANLLRYGDLVKFTDEDNPDARFTGVYEKRRRATVDEAEEFGQFTVYEGRGHVAILDEGIVLPEWLNDGAHTDDNPALTSRTFNFSSRYYNDSAWPNAVVTADESFGTPQDWWDTRDGSWIWDRILTGIYPAGFLAPIGDVYFRKSYTNASDKRVRIYQATDDLGELWADNDRFLEEVDWYHGQSQNVELELPAGTHVFAVKATNVNLAKAGLKFAMYELDANNEPGTLLLESDATWKCLGYPAAAPGYTPGGIVKRVLFELGSTPIVGTHKSLTDVSLGFDEWNDSDGAAWPTVTDFAVRIGDSPVDLLRQLAATYIDFAMDPDTLRLEAWVKGTRGGASGVELYAGTGGSLTSLDHEGTG